MDVTEGMSRRRLIFRALEEDHRAILAQSPEAADAHRELAKLMRERAAAAEEREVADEGDR